jgi:hypothetical protein
MEIGSLFRGLGPIRQVAYVVRDIGAAMAHWSDVIGVGPFFYFEQAPVEDFRYRGAPSSARMSAAFSNSGPMQIELIQPLDSEPSAFNDFLQSGQEGQHHIAFWTTELDACVERCARAGIEILQSGYTGAPDGRFVYFDTETLPGTIVEVSEVQGRKAKFFAEVARLCEAWDGTDPVRRLDI